MEENQVIETIKERRSVKKFKDDELHKEELKTILEAGRWAPSFANIQPWRFIVIEDEEIKQRLYKLAINVTAYRKGITQAPTIIAVSVDEEKDPHHYLEAGAVATQNMALAAHSLGISSYWIGIFDIAGAQESSEHIANKVLHLPENYRLVSLLPLGRSDQESTSERKTLEEIVDYDTFK